MRVKIDFFKAIIEEAIARGKVVVGAAGNNGPYGASIGIPAAIEQAISVGAVQVFPFFNDETIITGYLY